MARSWRRCHGPAVPPPAVAQRLLRDMTFMFAIGELTVQQWFAQLYAHADLAHEPASARTPDEQRFATRSLTADGEWRTSRSSTTPRRTSLLPLARCRACWAWRRPARSSAATRTCGHAPERFGQRGRLWHHRRCQHQRRPFWKRWAAGVLRVPLAMSVWDDGWRASVWQGLPDYEGQHQHLAARLPEGRRHQRHPHLQGPRVGLCRT